MIQDLSDGEGLQLPAFDDPVSESSTDEDMPPLVAEYRFRAEQSATCSFRTYADLAWFIEAFAIWNRCHEMKEKTMTLAQ